MVEIQDSFFEPDINPFRAARSSAKVPIELKYLPEGLDALTPE